MIHLIENKGRVPILPVTLFEGCEKDNRDIDHGNNRLTCAPGIRAI